jgi:hypothetical protein
MQDTLMVIQLALCTPSQKRNVSLFHLSTMADADTATFCMEITSYHNIFSMLYCLRLKSVALNVTHIFLEYLLLPPVLHRQLLL